MSTMSDENRVTPQESDEYDPPKSKDDDRITSLESEDYDLINPCLLYTSPSPRDS